MAKSVVFSKGKKSRNELRLPTLHYVVADDWINKLGEKPFCAWLKFHTWVDRTDEDREADLIPYTMESIAEKLEISKTTLYRTIIKPLWEYGLIDLIEYETSKRKAQKPVNIIVYESPKNAHETKVMAIEKLRDWKKDYGSSAQIYGFKGGRPKTEDSSDEADRFKNETVEKSDFNRFKNETVDGFKNETVTVSKMKPNNVSNISNNVSNALTNVSNNNPDQPDGTQAKTEKQKSVVVEVQSAWKDSFGASLPATKARLLLKDAKQESKSVMDAIKKVKRLKKDNNPIGAVRYELQYGWDEVPEKKDKPAGSQKNDDLDGLPSAFQKEAMTDEEKQKELEVDPEIQAQLEARLYRMRERLEEAKIKKKGVFAEKA